MNGLMMNYPLTVPAILQRAETLYVSKEIVNEQPDKSWHRYTYRDLAQRAKKLAVATIAGRLSQLRRLRPLAEKDGLIILFFSQTPR